MDRQAYNACIAKGLKGKTGISKEERQQLFCSTSKICSGKASNQDEAKKICLAMPLREGKPESEAKSTRRKRFNPRELSTCLLEHINGRPTTLAVLVEGIAACQDFKKPYGKKEFIKDCIKENSILGSMAETVKLNKQCQKDWSEKNVGIELPYQDIVA